MTLGTWNDPGTVRLLGEPWGDPSRRGVPWSKDPSVVRLDGRYLLYYSLPTTDADLRSGTGWSIGIAESTDLHSWVPIGVVPVFGEYDRTGACAAGAIVIDGRVHLFFQTYGRWRDDAVCHAVSDDGVRFVPHPENPVFRPDGDWTIGRAIDADVVRAGDRILLAYATRDPSFETQMIGTAFADLGSGFGRDAWTHNHSAGPALRPELEWETKCIEAAALRHDGETFTMIYAGGYNNEPQQLGWATSPDGITWVRGSDTPLVAHGSPGSWNSSESGHPGLFTDDDGRTYLLFQGNSDGGVTWRIATTEVFFDGARPVLDIVEHAR